MALFTFVTKVGNAIFLFVKIELIESIESIVLRRAFITNILLLVFVNLLIKPFFIFGIDLTVQNRAEPGAYGLYFALLNWTYLFQIINDFGLQNYNTRHVSSHPHLLEKYFPNLLIIKILLSIVYFFVALLAARFAGGYDYGALWLLAVLLANQVMVQIILFLRSSIAGLGFYRTDSLLSSLDKLLMLIFCGAALWWHGQTQAGTAFPVMWFALAQTLALVCTVAVVYGVLWSKSSLPLKPQLLTNLKTGWPVIRLLFRKSLPFAIVILLMSAYTRLDGILLERLLSDGAYHADVFAGGYRLLDALNMFGYLFASLLLPMFTRLIAKREPVWPLTLTGFQLIWVGSFTACVAIMSNSHDLIALMFPEKTDHFYRVEVCNVLIWCFLAVCVTYIFSTLLTAGEHLKAMNRIFVVGLLIDLVLDLTLIPHFQALGAAIAALSTQAFVALGMVWLSYQIFDQKPEVKNVVRLILFSGGLLVVALLLIQPSDWQWPVKFFAILFSGLVVSLITGMLDWRASLAGLRPAGRTSE